GNVVIKADITSEVAVKQMMAKIRSTYHALHILVNNAGIFDDHDGPIGDQAFERTFRNNLLGHVLVIKHALKLMTHGKIVNVSSVRGKLGFTSPSGSAYSAFKAALDNYTVNLAKHLAPKILVNAIAPGRVATPMWDNPNAARQKELGQIH